MVMYAKVRRMFFREHLSISAIERRISLSRNTIKKWLWAPDGTEPTYCRARAIVKLTPLQDGLNLSKDLRGQIMSLQRKR